ncbi:MAG: response regulator transcription factor [Oscillospiraceae bacterium]|nr:response regulator transcription factor [Oscillospiraceae bacterium]
MNCALIDDDRSALEQLQKLLTADLSEQFGRIPFGIDLFSDGRTFLEYWKPGRYDVVILEILMNGLSGLDVARAIRMTDQRVRLVFCSKSNGFAAESYQLDARYYLLKPISREAVSEMLSRINPELIQLRKTVTLPDGYTLLLRQILFTEYHNHVVLVHLKSGEIHRLRTNHNTMEELLIPCGYIRCPSKGILLNFHEIVDITDDSVLMSDGSSLPVSRRRRKEFQSSYNSFRLEKMQKGMIR